MEKSTKKGYSHSYTQNFPAKKLLTGVFLSSLLITTTAIGQSANLDQIRNGALGVYSTTPTADWVNGNAGPTNAHYAEGYSIPYRLIINGLVGNSNTIHDLYIEWDTKDQNGHAIDYITYYSNLNNPVSSHHTTFGHDPEFIDPTLGTSFSGTPNLFQIPAPSSTGSEVAGQPTTSFNNLPTASYTNNANATKMAIWGGTITSMTYVFQDAPDATTGSTKTQMHIQFKSADGSTALIAWGGHIAAEYDWGAGRGATGVNGSPYHTRLITIDGKPGNQDRSLKATAVIIPPPLCGISPAQLACPETDTLYFDATGSSTGLSISYVWTLTNGTPSAGAMISGSNTGFSIKVVPTGADFIAGGTFNLSLTVNKTGAQSTTCTRIPAGTIEKVLISAAANPTQIDITSAAHNTTLTASIDPTSTDTNRLNYTYQWSIVTAGTAGSLTNSTSRIATYTAGVADAGSTIQFRVIATQSSAPNCKDTALVSVTVSSVGTCDVTPSNAVCQGTKVTHIGSPKPKPTNATYVWSLQGYGGSGTTTSTFTALYPNGDTIIQVNASQSYRIVLTETYANTALNTSCYEDVTVVPTPTISTVYNPPACNSKYFTVDVVSPTLGYTYSIDQPGNNVDFSGQTKVPTAASPNVHFTNLVAGDGYIVTVTTTGPGCTATSSCDNSTPVCPSAGAITAKTQNTDEQVVKDNEPVKDNVATPEEVTTYKIALKSLTRVNAVPNPFTEKIHFNMLSAVSGYGSLELYNSLGQKIGVVYEGYIQAGNAIDKDYVVPKGSRTSLIYVFKVGDQRVTGKLIGLK